MSGVRGGRGGVAAAATVIAAGVLASVGAAGAAQDTTITAVGDATEGQWDKGVTAPVEIQTGEKVTWSFAGGGHNVESNSGDPGDGAAKDPAWVPYAYPPGEFQVAPKGSSGAYTFYKSGTYNFICVFHANMTGTIVVSGEDQEPPAETPVPPDPTPTPEPTPGPSGTAPPADDHTSTPPPTALADTVKPDFAAVNAKGVRRGARLTLRLSETATVTVRIRRRSSGKVVRTARLQVRAGTRTVTVRGDRLRRGRYTVELQARDAVGNASGVVRASVRIPRQGGR